MAPSNRKRDAENLQYKAAERKEFFKRLDQGGTIRAVAIELGITPDCAYRWRREAGVSTPRRANREYSAKDKTEIFRRLEIHQNVSAVARELGFVRVTCYKWAYAAGIFTGRDTSAQRDEFLALRKAGISRGEAARRTSTDKRTAMVSISKRPEEVELRTVPGHWEEDLTIGALHKSAIGTLVQRATR